VHLRDWIVGTELDWTTSGRVFEHTWPLIFGEPAVWCRTPLKAQTLDSCFLALLSLTLPEWRSA
jgi:hypothetical protein